MTALEDVLVDYLRIRRAMGYTLIRDGKLLAQFVAYLHQRGADTITTELALEWASLPVGPDRSWPARRLGNVRCFARYAQTINPATEVPPTRLLTGGPCRATPYLYSQQEITALLTAAAGLREPLRAATFQTLIGLLAVTGMRISEAIALDRRDLDSTYALLTVRNSKFNKTRELPLHPSSVGALTDYQRRRDQLCPSPSSPAILVSRGGNRLRYSNTQNTFASLLRDAGLGPRSASCRPRLHDLRHTFAVATLLDAYAQGEDARQRLALLSTYLGHIDPAATYWYLSAAPELMAFAGERLEQHLEARR